MNAIATTYVETAEAQAVRAASEGKTLARLSIAFTALSRLARDPNDLEQVFLLNIALNAGKLPELLTRFVMEPDGVALLSERPAIDSRSVDFDALRALPADTLGGAYVRFLDAHGLDADVFKAPPGMPPALAFLAQRMRQTHDLWHVLTGYEPDVPGEITLLAFSYAQTRMPGLGLLAALGALRHAGKHRGIIGATRRAYRRGQRARFLAATRWEQHWERPLAEVRAELGLA